MVGEGWRNEFSGGDAGNVVQAYRVDSIHFTQAAPRSLPIPQQLPPAPAGFLNRDEEVGILDDLLSESIQAVSPRTFIAVITGMPGVGKTSLALSWAERVREQFTDGQLYVNLHGYDKGQPTSAEHALDNFLRALDAPLSTLPVDVEALTGLYRSLLHGRRALIILDNARSAEQVRPLLPPSSCPVLVTSRSRLSGLVIREGAIRLALNTLPPVHAERLLTSAISGPLTDAESRTAAILAEQCAYLPLALRIVAERVTLSPQTEIAVLADEIDTERSDLNALAIVLDDESTEVRSVFSWSYHGLPPRAARMFRLLGLQTGPTVSSAAAAALADLPLAETRQILQVLADLNLLERAGHDRYRFHDLLGAYAAERAEAEETPEQRNQAIGRLASWYLDAADAADRMLAPLRRHVLPDPSDTDKAPLSFPDYDAALVWCETERQNLVAAVSLAAATGHHDQAWKLAMALMTFFHLRKYRTDRLATCGVALESARHIGDQRGEAWSLLSLGGALRDLRRPDEAIDMYQKSFDKWREIGDSYGQAQALSNLSEACRDVGQLDDSLEYGKRALTLWQEIGNRRSEAITLNDLGATCHNLGRFTQAVGYLERALDTGHGVDQHTEGLSSHLLGNSLRQIGQFPEAAEQFHHALVLQRAAGDRYGEAETLRSLAELQRQLNDLTSARECLRSALSIFRSLDDPQADDTQAELDQLHRDDHPSDS